MQSLQARITSAIDTWMKRHGLLPADRVPTLAKVIGTFCCRCAPPEEHEHARVEDYEVVARLLAVLLCLDDGTPGQDGAGRALDQIVRDGAAILARPQPAPSPWLGAVAELRCGVAGPIGRNIETFEAALRDHLDAVREEALVLAQARAGGEHAWAVRRDWLGDTLRLRPLVIGTEPYLRCWQTLRDCWPAPSLVHALEAEAPAVRRAYPHAVLDHAIDVARQAHAGGRARRSPSLSEIDALAVVATYLANDLGSRERDRRAPGPGGDPNLVLLLERYFLGRGDAGGAAGNTRARAALEHAEAMVVDMYNIGVSRFRAFRACALAARDEAGARQYLSLLARIVDGNLRSTIELAAGHAGGHTGGHAGGMVVERAGEHPGATPPGGQEAASRYSSLETLKRLGCMGEEP